jgi:dihydrofolate reductase
MAKLIYTATTSLDGYVKDASDSFDWAAPSEEVHAYINDLERPVGTYLYGRRLYETMRAWEKIGAEPGQAPVMYDYANIWTSAEKVVYSSTLDAASTARTRIERSFDPDAVRALKRQSATDLSIGGATLATTAIAAGLVDEFRQFIRPVVVGGGTRFLPDGVHLDLQLLQERRFEDGTVFVRYAAR